MLCDAQYTEGNVDIKNINYWESSERIEFLCAIKCKLLSVFKKRKKDSWTYTTVWQLGRGGVKQGLHDHEKNTIKILKM